MSYLEGAATFTFTLIQHANIKKHLLETKITEFQSYYLTNKVVRYLIPHATQFMSLIQ